MSGIFAAGLTVLDFKPCVSTQGFFCEQALQREAVARAEAERQMMIAQAVNNFLNKDLLASLDPDKEHRPGEGECDFQSTGPR